MMKSQPKPERRPGAQGGAQDDHRLISAADGGEMSTSLPASRTGRCDGERPRKAYRCAAANRPARLETDPQAGQQPGWARQYIPGTAWLDVDDLPILQTDGKAWVAWPVLTKEGAIANVPGTSTPQCVGILRWRDRETSQRFFAGGRGARPACRS